LDKLAHFLLLLGKLSTLIQWHDFDQFLVLLCLAAAILGVLSFEGLLLEHVDSKDLLQFLLVVVLRLLCLGLLVRVSLGLIGALIHSLLVYVSE